MRTKNRNKKSFWNLEQGKKAKTFLCLFALLSLNLLYANTAASLPQDYEVVSGSAEFRQQDNTLTINASNNAIVNYRSFDIAANEKVVVNLPDASSQILNRVNSNLPTNIYGSLTSNGLIILVNGSGIYVAPTANISAGSLVLSTRDITNEHFLQRNYVFEKISRETLDRLLLNEGSINIAQGGFGVLIAGAVENRGVITARAGTIAMAGGNGVRLSIKGRGLVSIDITEAVAAKVYDYQGNSVLDQIKNRGMLSARGGTIILAASSLPDIFRAAINLDGFAMATKAEEKNGVIRIVADGEVSIGGAVEAANVSIGANINNITSKLPEIATIVTRSDPVKVNIQEGAALKAEEIINIAAQNAIDIGSAIEAPTVTLVSGGSIDTRDAAIIQGTNVNLTANRLGTSVTPVSIQADTIHITRLNGNIDIRQSTGIGTSVMITGPPDDYFKILYPENADLCLEAGRISVSEGVILSANSLTLTAKDSISSYGSLLAAEYIVLSSQGPVISIGRIETDTFTERGASFILGGYFGVNHSSMTNDDGAADVTTGTYHGEVSDPGDLWVVQDAVITLDGDMVFWADKEAIPDEKGIFWMDTDSKIVGGGFNLTIYSAYRNADGTETSSTLREISGVGTLTLKPSKSDTTHTTTYDSLESTAFSVTTLGTDYHAVFTRSIGSGISEDPYMIYSVSDADGGLQYILTMSLSAYYKLANNIDASETATWNWAGSGDDYYGFSPIGYGYYDAEWVLHEDPFIGTFDGNGHTITGLTMSRPTGYYYLGLFGYTNNATIKNVGLISVNITGEYEIGGLVGLNQSSLISNCYSSGSVTGNSNMGGLVGENSSSEIFNSYSSCTVTGDDTTGGLVGWSEGSTITNCYSSGSVTGSDYTGGLVGFNYTTTITNCYSSGSVTGTGYATGGLVGESSDSTTITNCYSSGPVIGDEATGGLMGHIEHESDIINSYATGTVSGGSDTGGLIGYNESSIGVTTSYFNKTVQPGMPDEALYGKTTTEMKQKATYSGWDFNGLWKDGSGAAYPAFFWQEMKYNAGFIGGTSEMPMQISNANELQFMSHYLSGYYQLANDIDASDTVNWNSGAGFAPVGYSTGYDYEPPTNPFTGDLDGGGHTITGLTIDREEEDFVGLFGATDGSMITDVGLVDVRITGSAATGGLAGSLYSSTISGSYSTGTVTGYYDTGGLAGLNFSSTISDSYSACTVTGADYIGGLVGWNYSSAVISGSHFTGTVEGSNDSAGGLAGGNESSTISKSYSTGTVTGAYSTGGLVGFNFSSSIISNCYSTGAVEGISETGGLVGTNASSTISYSYSTGTAASSDTPGGLIGYDESGTLTNNYWDVTTSGLTTSAGQGNSAVEGKTTVEMKQQAAYSGWGFGADGISAGSPGEWIMAGYPHLQAEWSANITNLAQLQMAALDLDASYTLASDIDASGTATWNWDGTQYLGFAPVGTFAGIFDGKNKTITGLTINRSADNVGFFGAASGATLSNIHLLNVDITGGNCVGGLVGVNISSNIADSSSSGSVSGGDNNCYIGGLVGCNGYSSAITGSYSSGTVSGGDGSVAIGGLVGYNDYSSTITGSYSSGTVTGGDESNDIGGLVGYNDHSSDIDNSYASGDVSCGESSYHIGGLVGYNCDSDIISSYASGDVSCGFGSGDIGGLVGENYYSSTITGSYSSGTVTGGDESDDIGGLVGYNDHSSDIDNSYASGDVSCGESSYHIGGLVGLNVSSTITNSYSSGTVSGGGGSYNLGGLVGYAQGSDYYGVSDITNSYATGTVSGPEGSTGGLVGFDEYYVYETPGGVNVYTNNWWFNIASQGVGNTDPVDGVSKAGAAADFFHSTYASSRPGSAVYDQEGAYGDPWDFTTVPIWDSFAAKRPRLHWEYWTPPTPPTPHTPASTPSTNPANSPSYERDTAPIPTVTPATIGPGTVGVTSVISLIEDTDEDTNEDNDMVNTD